MYGLGSESTKPKLFNWVTVALVTGWVLLVGVVAEHSQEVDATATPQEFIERLVK